MISTGLGPSPEPLTTTSVITTKSPPVDQDYFHTSKTNTASSKSYKQSVQSTTSTMTTEPLLDDKDLIFTTMASTTPTTSMVPNEVKPTAQSLLNMRSTPLESTTIAPTTEHTPDEKDHLYTTTTTSTTITSPQTMISTQSTIGATVSMPSITTNRSNTSLDGVSMILYSTWLCSKYLNNRWVWNCGASENTPVSDTFSTWSTGEEPEGDLNHTLVLNSLEDYSFGMFHHDQSLMYVICEKGEIWFTVYG